MQRRHLLKTAFAASAFPVVARGEGKRFWVPSEDVAHELTFMQWPVSRQVYRDLWFLNDVQNAIAQIANTISEFEPVILLADKQYHRHIRSLVSDRVELWDIPTDDLWCRDAGPIFATDGMRLQVQHIQFNGWGNRQTFDNDEHIAGRVADRLGIPLRSFDLRGEAGGVEQDGHGTLIAHESSWVHSNRNKGMSRGDIEEVLLTAYGAHRIIWTKGVKDQDITDYHIDSVVRFTGPSRCLINLPIRPDQYDPFHVAAQDTYKALIQARIDIDVIPEPNRPRNRHRDFVASYANFYVCNNAVLAAEFGDKETDELARSALQRHLPDREIVMLNVDVLGELGGGIHCATHEMPAL